MKSPKEEYEYLKNINNINDIAYYELFEKYLILNKKGIDKLTEIDSTDQEGIIVSRNGGYPISGMIYTFIYGDLDSIKLKFEKKDFIDIAPIVFCITTQQDRFKGINMNLLPNNIRLEFLNAYFYEFKEFFSNQVEILSQNQKLALNKKFIEYVKTGKAQNVIKFFNDKVNANFNYGYRSYKFEKIKNLRMIEYSEWNYIPFYEPKNAFRLLNFKQIHQMYFSIDA